MSSRKIQSKFFKVVLKYNFWSLVCGFHMEAWQNCWIEDNPIHIHLKADTWFHCFRVYLLPPESQPLHEVVYFSAAHTLREHLNAAPRIALHTALNNPYYYLKVRRKLVLPQLSSSPRNQHHKNIQSLQFCCNERKLAALGSATHIF